MNTYVYGHPLIEKIVLRSSSARVYTTTGNVYQIWAYPNQKFTSKDLDDIVVTAIRKEMA
jgi:hypothetical protein